MRSREPQEVRTTLDFLPQHRPQAVRLTARLKEHGGMQAVERGDGLWGGRVR